VKLEGDYNMASKQVTMDAETANKIVLGSMAPTYFVSVAAIVAAFYAKEAVVNK
jgi:hypothetical protein